MTCASTCSASRSAPPARPRAGPGDRAAFREELRRQTVRPLRLACLLVVMLTPLFAAMTLFSPIPPQPTTLVARGLMTAVAAAVYFASGTARGQRWSQSLAVAIIVLVAALVTFSSFASRGALVGPSTASFELALLGGSVLFPLTPRRTLAMLTAITAGYLVVSASFGGDRVWRLAYQTTIFVAAIEVGTLAVRLSYRLRRSEFYNRYRLVDANRRLARLEHR